MVDRRFLPVGHGGFAVEKHRNGKEDYNLVFDCGSTKSYGEKRDNAAEKQIPKVFQQGEKIDKLFISHLHVDHLNGVPCLLEHCRVEHIYLPYLTPEEKILSLMELCWGDLLDRPTEPEVQEMTTDGPLENREAADERRGPLFGKERTLRLCQQLLSGQTDAQMFGETEVHRVYTSEQAELFAGKNNDILFAGINQKTDIKSENQIPLTNGPAGPGEWLLIPCTYCGMERSKQFRALLKERQISINDLLWEMMGSKFWRDRRKKTAYYELYQSYKAIRPNINETTMTVFSGTSSEDVSQYLYKRGECYSYTPKDKRVFYPAGCLYMGDYPARGREYWEDLCRAYGGVWRRIGVFTLPHHGSQYNHNANMISSSACYVVQGGVEDAHHPHETVLASLEGKKAEYYCVNELEQTEAHFRVCADRDL